MACSSYGGAFAGSTRSCQSRKVDRGECRWPEYRASNTLDINRHLIHCRKKKECLLKKGQIKETTKEKQMPVINLENQQISTGTMVGEIFETFSISFIKTANTDSGIQDKTTVKSIAQFCKPTKIKNRDLCLIVSVTILIPNLLK